MAELVTIVIPTERLKDIVRTMSLTSKDYELKSVRVVDDMFKDDETYKLLKREADQKYKELEEYMFNRRHNIK